MSNLGWRIIRLKRLQVYFEVEELCMLSGGIACKQQKVDTTRTTICSVDSFVRLGAEGNAAHLIVVSYLPGYPHAVFMGAQGFVAAMSSDPCSWWNVRID